MPAGVNRGSELGIGDTFTAPRSGSSRRMQRCTHLRPGTAVLVAPVSARSPTDGSAGQHGDSPIKPPFFDVDAIPAPCSLSRPGKFRDWDARFTAQEAMSPTWESSRRSRGVRRCTSSGPISWLDRERREYFTRQSDGGPIAPAMPKVTRNERDPSVPKRRLRFHAA